MENLKAGEEKIQEVKMETKTRRNKTSMSIEEDIEDQEKFFIDVSKNPELKAMIHQLLHEANKKSFGRKVVFKDFISPALSKLTSKDIEKIQEGTITEDERLEKIEKVCREFNEKNGSSLTVGEFVLKKLNLV